MKISLETLPESGRFGTEDDTISSRIVKDLGHFYFGSIEEITSEARRVSIHKDPFDFSVH